MRGGNDVVKQRGGAADPTRQRDQSPERYCRPLRGVQICAGGSWDKPPTALYRVLSSLAFFSIRSRTT